MGEHMAFARADAWNGQKDRIFVEVWSNRGVWWWENPHTGNEEGPFQTRESAVSNVRRYGFEPE